MLPYDVDSRWNSLYLMMFKAQEHKASIVKFARSNPEVQHLIPNEAEWETVKVMERVLMLFYDHTRSVSKDQPCLPETIEIMWGLDDLLDDI